MKRIFIIVAAVLITGCTDERTAERALTAAGYSGIQFTGYSMWSCSEDDTFKTGFQAIGPTGHAVTGTVCNSWFKGATIRID